ncbi:hypothetical protein FOZ61_010457 [Perkinsus olseni]|uniref:6-pyruvoyltetrahydropterin synthase n=1 Tax=Perkinsus olseni TaxID=32597 RepID=A0A7J6L0Q1_PEROL|nr:hypothetical protein FOZ61_010457 [Perkinsus olseni]KAF4653010.1 hypothetical protein FOL46_009406 [Perkinsus olseni]
MPNNVLREVEIQGKEFKFSCGHFVAHPGFRERLHGHNYTVKLRMTCEHWPAGEDGYVIDFGILKKLLRAVCKSLNERMIIPERSRSLDIDTNHLHVTATGKEQQSVRITTIDGDEFLFPKDDCVILPIEFATAEELSEYVFNKMVEGLGTIPEERGLAELTVSVYERPTQCAKYTGSLRPQASQ